MSFGAEILKSTFPVSSVQVGEETGAGTHPGWLTSQHGDLHVDDVVARAATHVLACVPQGGATDEQLADEGAISNGLVLDNLHPLVLVGIDLTTPDGKLLTNRSQTVVSQPQLAKHILYLTKELESQFISADNLKGPAQLV